MVYRVGRGNIKSLSITIKKSREKFHLKLHKLGVNVNRKCSEEIQRTLLLLTVDIKRKSNMNCDLQICRMFNMYIEILLSC